MWPIFALQLSRSLSLPTGSSTGRYQLPGADEPLTSHSPDTSSQLSLSSSHLSNVSYAASVLAFLPRDMVFQVTSSICDDGEFSASSESTRAEYIPAILTGTGPDDADPQWGSWTGATPFFPSAQTHPKNVISDRQPVQTDFLRRSPNRENSTGDASATRAWVQGVYFASQTNNQHLGATSAPTDQSCDVRVGHQPSTLEDFIFYQDENDAANSDIIHNAELPQNDCRRGTAGVATPVTSLQGESMVSPEREICEDVSQQALNFQSDNPILYQRLNTIEEQSTDELGGPSDSEVLTCLQRLEHKVDRLQQTIEGLLNYSKETESEEERFPHMLLRDKRSILMAAGSFTDMDDNTSTASYVTV